MQTIQTKSLKASSGSPHSGKLTGSSDRINRTFAALLIFFVVNAVWSQLKIGILKPQDFPFYTWTGLAVEHLLKKEVGRPNIAFVGSSLVLYPVGNTDSDLINGEIDAPRHNRSWYFERKFKEATGHDVTTFNFSLPGEMPSDAFLIEKFLLKGEKSPDVLVYGVGPRDFMDNLLPCPQATDPFLWLSRFGDYNDHIASIAPDWQTRLTYELGRAIFTYGHRIDLSTSGERVVASVLDKVAPATKPLSIADRRQIMPEYHPFECGVNDAMFRPYVDRPQPAFVDNVAEYKNRYRELKWDTFLTQMKFLSETIDIAKSRGTTVVLVSMPITDINRRLLGAHATDVYNKAVHVLAASKGVKLVDLFNSGGYEIADFNDTVHLNSAGGRKMLSALATEFAEDKKISGVLNFKSEPVAGTLVPSVEHLHLASRKESLL
jgi:hypothetical protein